MKRAPHQQQFATTARRAASMLCALTFVLGARVHAQVTVFVRGDAPPIVAETIFGDAHGLEIRAKSGGGEAQRRVLPWDMVRAVEGAASTGSFGEFLTIGTDLWRARIRIERGDFALAQPLLAKQWARFRAADGPTAALVAEGLLRCALAQQDVRAATDPWLACVRHRSAGQTTRFPALPAVLDADTGLLPELSPFLPAVRRAEVIAACNAAGATGEAGEVAARIVRIARLTEPTSATDPSAANATASGNSSFAAMHALPPAVRALAFVESIVVAADARALEQSILDFDRAYPEPVSSLGAWRLAALGTCRARLARAMPESNTNERAALLGRAALELLAVPASGLDRTGLVEAYALEEAARLLRASGDEASAAQLDAILSETSLSTSSGLAAKPGRTSTPPSAR